MDIGNDNLIEFYYIYLITKLDKIKLNKIRKKLMSCSSSSRYNFIVKQRRCFSIFCNILQRKHVIMNFPSPTDVATGRIFSPRKKLFEIH